MWWARDTHTHGTRETTTTLTSNVLKGETCRLISYFAKNEEKWKNNERKEQSVAGSRKNHDGDVLLEGKEIYWKQLAHDCELFLFVVCFFQKLKLLRLIYHWKLIRTTRRSTIEAIALIETIGQRRRLAWRLVRIFREPIHRLLPQPSGKKWNIQTGPTSNG